MKMQYLLILFFFTVFPVAAEQSLTVQDVIAKHTEAIGGRAALEAVKAAEIVIMVEEPTFKVKGVWQGDRKQRMRIDIYSDEALVYTEVFDGTRAWQQKGPEAPVEDASAKGTAALWHGSVLPGKVFGLHEHEALGSVLKLKEREQVDGVNYYVVELTLKDGYQIDYYVNPESWLVERSRTVQPLHPDIDPTEVITENRFSDFRKTDGIVRSFHAETVDLKTNKVVQTTTILSVKSNPPINDAIFLKPQS